MMNLITQIQLNDFKEYCIRVFSHVEPGSTFLSISNYKNNFDETSNFSVCFHIDYLKAVERSLVIVDKYKPCCGHTNNKKFKLKDLVLARNNILHSFAATLAGSNENYTCKDVYAPILGADNRPIPGIKLHSNQDVVHINALKFKKNIIKRGIYPLVDSSPETLARRYIMSLTPLSDWVQFKLYPGRFDKLTVQRMIIKG